MIYNIISTGSTGNAVIYYDCILVDCGISYTKLKPFLKDIKLVLLTHIHNDHFNKRTIQRLAFERPTLRFACCKWLKEKLEELGVRNIDVMRIGGLYKYGEYTISPIQLYHDVPNCGYRIFKGNHKIIHATDTAHLEGIYANGYDMYALEFNYDEKQIEIDIQEKTKNGIYAHEIGSKNSHLSFQQAVSFIEINKKESSEIVKLHMSKRYL